MAFNSVLPEDLLLVKLSCNVASHNLSFNSIQNYVPFTTEECLTLIYHVYMYFISSHFFIGNMNESYDHDTGNNKSTYKQ